MKDRDVEAFDRRAGGYESGAVGQMHLRIGEHAAEIALAVAPAPRRLLDVGCGTGALLRLLAARLPRSDELVGVDPARAMVKVASSHDDLDPRIHVSPGTAEALPFPAASFDLVVSTTSFDHWADQRAGLAECARVLRPGCPLVLCDLFSPFLLPTMWLGHRGKARTVRSGSAALRSAGFHCLTWHPSLLLKTVVAS